MPDAFDESKADLSGIADPSQLPGNPCVDKATQDAYVMVDGKGTKAADATVIVGTVEAPPRFIADRPFLHDSGRKQDNPVHGMISDSAR